MWRVLVFSFVISLVIAGCEKPSPQPKPPAVQAAKTNLQLFQVKGIVMEVDRTNKTVEIRHEEIPNYMKAMTMPFDVKDTNELKGVDAGDPISFRLTVAGNDAWIDQIQVIGPRTNVLPTTGPFRRTRDVEMLNEGDVLPPYAFTNQFGKAFNTADFKGQALAITFLFTRCPYPTFCPRMANNFAEVQQKMLALPNSPTNWHLLTISFDPEFDTPAMLKTYAEAHGYDPQHSTYATGELIEITAITEQFGQYFARDEVAGITHNLRTIVITASGRVQKIFNGNEWTPDELIDELVKATAR